jgi:hypothetical protein
MKTTNADPPAAITKDMHRLLRLRKALLMLGILAALTWIISDLNASYRYEGYSWPVDAISGLSAVGSPVQSMSRVGTLIYDMLRIGFAAGVWLSAGGQRSIRITAAALLAFSLTDFAASIFPWYPEKPLTSPENLAHSAFAGALPMLWIFLSIGTGAHAGSKGFRTFSYVIILAMLILGALPLLDSFVVGVDQPPALFGASERINAYGYMVWMMALAVVLLRKLPASQKFDVAASTA